MHLGGLNEKPVACLNVDVDSLGEYCRIHGLSPQISGNQVYDLALERFLKVFDDHGVKATFFVVGKDLESSEANREMVARLASHGHEIANHTWGHPYALLKLDERDRLHQIRECQRVIEEVTGQAPRGFRAPGYSVDGRLLRMLAGEGLLYDSSAFPSIPYYLAKAGIMGLMRLVGRRSASILGDLRVLMVPKMPYWPRDSLGGLGRGGRPMSVAGRLADPGASSMSTQLLEVPISLLRPLGIPVIGTTVNMAGVKGVKRLFPWVKRSCPFLNLEFHAVDLLGLNEDGIAPVLSVQPDLKIPLVNKIATINETVRLIAETYRVVRLDELSGLFAGE